MAQMARPSSTVAMIQILTDGGTMGYTIRIGEAVVTDCDYYWECAVERMELPDAPESPAAGLGKANEAWPSYSSWPDFCRAVVLYDVFFNEDYGLMHNHPDCAKLTEAHVIRFEAALKAFRAEHPEAVPRYVNYIHDEGFAEYRRRLAEDTTVSPHDATLARLEWLCWWSRWAITNCARPALYNK